MLPNGCKSNHVAIRVTESITRFFEGELYLHVNKGKTVLSYVEGIKYLGYFFYISKGKCHLRYIRNPKRR